jgi:hypothetical protein
MMKRFLRQILNGQGGQALPIVLALLAFGGLTMVPLLNYMSDGLRASQIQEVKRRELYSADSGIENACWRLLHESYFVESMTEQNPSAEYSININNKDVSIMVTRIAGLAGDTCSMDVDYMIPSGHQLELRAVVFDDDHMHFAYDTDAYQAWLQMPVAEGNPTYYLHNNPTPPIGDTDAQPNLPMDEDNPTADSFYNYDQNYDSDPGRRIEESDGGPDGLELKEYQNWLTSPYAEDTHFQGAAVLNLYVAPDGFNFDNAGSFRVYLRDYDPVGETYTEITSIDYEIGEGEWVEMWQPTAHEGKYKIVATVGNTQLKQLVALGFGYLRVIYFINESTE